MNPLSIKVCIELCCHGNNKIYYIRKQDSYDFNRLYNINCIICNMEVSIAETFIYSIYIYYRIFAMNILLF